MLRCSFRESCRISGGMTVVKQKSKDVSRCLVPIVAAIFLFSCAAKKPPAQLSITVPEGYAGPLYITPCVPTQPSDRLTTDAQGRAVTSTCPREGDEIELLVVKSGRTYFVASSQVKILRAGDGIAVEIRASVP